VDDTDSGCVVVGLIEVLEDEFGDMVADEDRDGLPEGDLVAE